MIAYYFTNEFDLTKKYSNDAGWDLYSTGEYTIAPFTSVVVNTGIYLCMVSLWEASPFRNVHYTEQIGTYHANILPRSSITKTPLMVQNSPGLIDAGYTGELGICFINVGNTEYTIKHGDKIAQLVLVSKDNFDTVQKVQTRGEFDTLCNNYGKVRGNNGFGSTGFSYEKPVHTIKTAKEIYGARQPLV